MKKLISILVLKLMVPSAFMGVAIGQNWALVSTPGAATQISDFDIDASNCWFISDRSTGFYKSCDHTNWVSINSGIPIANQACPAMHLMFNPHNNDMIGMVDNTCAGVPTATYYRLPNASSTWTPIPNATGFSTSLSAQQPRSTPTVSGGNLVLGGQGATGQTAMYSANDGVTTSLSAESPAIGNIRGLFTLTNGHIAVGTENGGYFESADGGVNIGNVWAWFGNGANPTNGEIAGIAQDCAGNLILGSTNGIWRSFGTYPSYGFDFVFRMTQRARAVYRDSQCTLYAGQRQIGSSVTVWRSINGGGSWAEWDTGLPLGREAQRFLENSGILFVLIEDGSTNNGWLYQTPIGAPTSPAPVPSLFADAPSHSRGLNAIDLARVATMLAAKVADDCVDGVVGPQKARWAGLVAGGTLCLVTGCWK